MSRSIAWLLSAAACLAGCQNAAPKLSETERIGVETTSPTMVDGVIESNALTTVTQDYSPTQLTSLPIGGDCTVQTTDPNRSVHGTIAAATAAGIVLVDAEEMIASRNATGSPITRGIPQSGRLFRNVGVQREAHPIGSATIPPSEIVSVRVSQVINQ